MRLISIHVNNFGRLSDFTYDFDEKLNHISGANGWGKSTMAAFIRVMFYGFEGEGKRGILENERKRWEPWQGGVYGGSLTFTEDGRTYTVTRTFKSKAAEDTFELRNADTNLVSDDYSSRLGEELFGVNAESYMRTAFIGQNDVVTNTTDGINAKIGNIADSTNDLDCFEKASERLAGMLNNLSPKRSTGSISRLKADVTRLQTDVRNGSAIIDSMHRLDDSIVERQAALETLSAERNVLITKQKAISEFKDIQADKEVYASICEAYEERKSLAVAKRGEFSDKLPTEEEINIKLEEAAGAAGLKGTIDMYKLSSEEESELARLGARYEDASKDVSENAELVRRWRIRESRALNESGRQADLKIMQNELDAIKREKKTLPGLAIVGLVLIIAAMAIAVSSLLILPSIMLIRIGVGAAAVVMIVGILLTILKLRAHTADIDERIKRQTNLMDELEQEIAEDIRARNEVDGALTDYLRRYGMAFNQATLVEDMERIQKEIIRLDDLEVKRGNFDEACEKHSDILKRVDDYIISLGKVPEDNRQSQLNKMLLDLRSLVDADKQAEAAYNKKSDYEANHDLDRIMKAKLPEDMPELGEITAMIAEVNTGIDKLNAELNNLNRQHEDLQEKLDEWEENRETLAAKEKQLLDMKKKYERIDAAKKYLTEAKETMTAKYMDPLIKGFGKYYGAITGADAAEYRIDANTNLSIEASGLQRDTRFLSTGYQDLIGFCMRLSLIDAMYEEEKPMLILDDPFVNLDTPRMASAEALLNILSKDYQLLYFTCH